MPSLEHHVAEPKLNDVFSKDDGVQDLKLSVTESTSFGSPIPEYDEQDLQLTLSSDSMGFNFQESFDIGTGPSFDGTIEERSLSPAMDTVSSEKNTTNTNETTQGDVDSHHKISYPKGSYPPIYSTQPCQQPHSYYGSHYPQSHGSYAFYPQSYAPPHYGYNPSAMSSDQSIHQNHSSELSVSSNLSKKRSIDEVNDTNGDFTIHRGGSNNSVSSYSTTNTAPTQISRLSNGSPMKREDFCPSTLSLERSNSTESNDSSLAFSTLTVNSKNESKGESSKFCSTIFHVNMLIRFCLQNKRTWLKRKLTTKGISFHLRLMKTCQIQELHQSVKTRKTQMIISFSAMRKIVLLLFHLLLCVDPALQKRKLVPHLNLISMAIGIKAILQYP